MAQLYYFDKYRVEQNYSLGNPYISESEVDYGTKYDSGYSPRYRIYYSSLAVDSKTGEIIYGTRKTIELKPGGNNLNNELKGLYSTKGTSGVEKFIYEKRTRTEPAPEGGTYWYGIWETESRDIVIVEKRGSKVGQVTGTYNQYPSNGKHTDGYWYVRIGLVFPELKIKINGTLNTSENGWVKVNNQLREIDKIWVKVNGSLKEVQ